MKKSSKKTNFNFRKERNINLKKHRGRKVSSSNWLLRQLNDPFVQQANKLGYRSRAAFKLLEIDEKFNILTRPKIIVDLGSTPGSWCQVIRQRCKSDAKILAIDINQMEEIPGVHFILGDFEDDATWHKAEEYLQQDVPSIEPKKLVAKNTSDGGFGDAEQPSANSSGNSDSESDGRGNSDSSDGNGRVARPKIDLLLSDMASPSCGDKKTDHIRIIALLELAYEFAQNHLKQGGNFICKILMGGIEKEIYNELKQNFGKICHFKPNSSRKESSELYIICQDFNRKHLNKQI